MGCIRYVGYYQTLDWVDRKQIKPINIVVVEQMSLAPKAFDNIKLHLYGEKKPKMVLISEYLAADSSPDASVDALAIINIGKSCPD